MGLDADGVAERAGAVQPERAFVAVAPAVVGLGRLERSTVLGLPQLVGLVLDPAVDDLRPRRPRARARRARRAPSARDRYRAPLPRRHGWTRHAPPGRQASRSTQPRLPRGQFSGHPGVAIEPGPSGGRRVQLSTYSRTIRLAEHLRAERGERVADHLDPAHRNALPPGRRTAGRPASRPGRRARRPPGRLGGRVLDAVGGRDRPAGRGRTTRPTSRPAWRGSARR